MNTIWSDEIQSSEILYYSRFARFNDNNKNDWFSLINIKDGMKILEVGCGPGHFTNMIKKYYPSNEIYGIDLDNNHIDFAKKIAEEYNLHINYSIGDATNLPYENDTFDIIFSHTLVEHLPFENFIKEQKRVLKDGGKIIFMHVDAKRKHINEYDFNSAKINKLYNEMTFENTKHNVGQYLLTPHEYLHALDKFGFKNARVDFAEILFYFPDLCNDKNEGLSQINNQKVSEINNALFSLKLSSNGNTLKNKLLNLIEEKFSKRIKLYLQNTKVYDYESTAINVFTAIK